MSVNQKIYSLHPSSKKEGIANEIRKQRTSFVDQLIDSVIDSVIGQIEKQKQAASLSASANRSDDNTPISKPHHHVAKLNQSLKQNRSVAQ